VGVEDLRRAVAVMSAESSCAIFVELALPTMMKNSAVLSPLISNAAFFAVSSTVQPAAGVTEIPPPRSIGVAVASRTDAASAVLAASTTVRGVVGFRPLAFRWLRWRW
jgi:hypothetical protein